MTNPRLRPDRHLYLQAKNDIWSTACEVPLAISSPLHAFHFPSLGHNLPYGASGSAEDTEIRQWMGFHCISQSIKTENQLYTYLGRCDTV